MFLLMKLTVSFNAAADYAATPTIGPWIRGIYFQ